MCDEEGWGYAATVLPCCYSAAKALLWCCYGDIGGMILWRQSATVLWYYFTVARLYDAVVI